jgi:hypothetical protein
MQLDLPCLLQYKNNKVISRYQSDFPDSKMRPEEALEELLKFIWLSHKLAADKKHFPANDALHFSCVIHHEMAEIDNMWHTFLLFTRDYHTFCQKHLAGVFFHHDPLVSTGAAVSTIAYELELNRYLSYIYDNLGETTLIKWFMPGIT